jgi:hypothetical protein
MEMIDYDLSLDGMFVALHITAEFFLRPLGVELRIVLNFLD